MANNRYNRNHCDNIVRAVIEDKLGRRVTLLGKHAFEWSIVLESDGRTVITTFPNRREAKKEFNNYKNKR